MPKCDPSALEDCQLAVSSTVALLAQLIGHNKQASLDHCRGTKVRDVSGRELFCIPLPAYWMVDRKAANALLNVKHWPARFCDLWHLIPIEKMGEPTSKPESFPRRTETDMKKVPLVVLYCSLIQILLPEFGAGLHAWRLPHLPSQCCHPTS